MRELDAIPDAAAGAENTATVKSSAKKTRPRGSVRQVAPGKFHIRIGLGMNEVTGKYERIKRVVHGTRKDAERVRAGIVRDLDLGTYAPASSKTVGEQFDAWLKEQRAAFRRERSTATPDRLTVTYGMRLERSG